MRYLLPALLLAVAACGGPGHPASRVSNTPGPIDAAPAGQTWVSTPPVGGACPDGLRFYEPACSEHTYEPGCFVPCAADGDCGVGAMCVTIDYDPCTGRGGGDDPADPSAGPPATCEACGAQAMVCQAVSTID